MVEPQQAGREDAHGGNWEEPGLLDAAEIPLLWGRNAAFSKAPLERKRSGLGQGFE